MRTNVLGQQVVWGIGELLHACVICPDHRYCHQLYTERALKVVKEELVIQTSNASKPEVVAPSTPPHIGIGADWRLQTPQGRVGI